MDFSSRSGSATFMAILSLATLLEPRPKDRSRKNIEPSELPVAENFEWKMRTFAMFQIFKRERNRICCRSEIIIWNIPNGKPGAACCSDVLHKFALLQIPANVTALTAHRLSCPGSMSNNNTSRTFLYLCRHPRGAKKYIKTARM